jgi:hypothetical protein
MQNNLPVLPQYTCRQISAAICRETGPIAQQCVPYLFLPIRAVNAVAVFLGAVMVGVNFTGRNYPNIIAPGPGHYPAHISQNSPVVPYTRITTGKEEIFLRIDIYQNPPAPPFKQLTNHFLNLPPS